MEGSICERTRRRLLDILRRRRFEEKWCRNNRKLRDERRSAASHQKSKQVNDGEVSGKGHDKHDVCLPPSSWMRQRGRRRDSGMI